MEPFFDEETWVDPIRTMYESFGPNPGFSYHDYSRHISRGTGWEYVGDRPERPAPLDLGTLDIDHEVVTDEPKLLEP